jgi:hypothetical protein
MSKNLEIRTIEHKGVRVTFRINYDDGTAELVERIDGRWNVKQWVFKPRGLEYMNGWQDILEAMAVAVRQCKIALEEDLAMKTGFSEEFKNEIVSITKGRARKFNTEVPMTTEEFKKYRSNKRIKAMVEQVKRK